MKPDGRRQRASNGVRVDSANTYDTADFGIYIDDIGIGENLKNGLIGELIDKASIEDAVIALSKDKD